MLQIRYFPKITSDFGEFNRLPPLDKELSALRVVNHDWVEIRKMSIEFSVVSLFIQWQRHTHSHRQHSGIPTERRQYTHTHTRTFVLRTEYSQPAKSCDYVCVQVNGALVCVHFRRSKQSHWTRTNTIASHTQVLLDCICVRLHVGNCAYVDGWRKMARLCDNFDAVQRMGDTHHYDSNGRMSIIMWKLIWNKCNDEKWIDIHISFEEILLIVAIIASSWSEFTLCGSYTPQLTNWKRSRAFERSPVHKQSWK